jgi:hypothetical protein
LPHPFGPGRTNQRASRGKEARPARVVKHYASVQR